MDIRSEESFAHEADSVDVEGDIIGFFLGMTGGVFVDVGANDGVFKSTTYLLETEYQWTGICIEPNNNPFADLQRNRSCFVINAAIADQAGSGTLNVFTGRDQAGFTALRPDQRLIDLYGIVPSYEQPIQILTLNEVLESFDIQKIDFLTIDIEGGEYDALSHFDFAKYQPKLVCAEDHFSDLPDLFRRNRYRLLKSDGINSFYIPDNR